MDYTPTISIGLVIISELSADPTNARLFRKNFVCFLKIIPEHQSINQILLKQNVHQNRLKALSVCRWMNLAGHYRVQEMQINGQTQLQISQLLNLESMAVITLDIPAVDGSNWNALSIQISPYIPIQQQCHLSNYSSIRSWALYDLCIHKLQVAGAAIQLVREANQSRLLTWSSFEYSTNIFFL